ncbi:uncharacterized protein N0V89_001765 [Didymosphaeria variabile]|uniref:Uncharacterized protein n=1 Tax=Didymosphaeria variabile TaxID=1932322 RepID=A0A9W8XQE5_9PLEO|nr:uncharacterized protein N0V89_001765 [Didymosphaeria variabile]KAJ4357190.1 hypothetical protein N0V89_001765 [Didymosphaeria variabile]
MTDYSSQTLLTPPSRAFGKPYGASNGISTTYKLPLLILWQLSILATCIAGAVIVLLASQKELAHSWSITPAVWLSLIAGVYVVVLGALFSTGVAVIWWRCIAHGTTLERLHLVHTGSSLMDLVPAFLAGWHARKVAVAALFILATKLAVGPMLQRSTSPKSHEATKDIQMTIDIASEIPDGWFTSRSNSISTSQATFFGDDIATRIGTNHLCPGNGTCRARVKAAGMNLWNTTDSKTLNLLDLASLNETIFSIDLSINSDFGVPILFLETTFVSAVDNDCIATVTHETYGMIPATMQYPITIHGSRIMPDILGALENPIIISNNSNVNGSSSALRGIRDALRPVYLSKGALSLPQEGKPSVRQDLNGFWVDMFATTGVVSGSKYPENVVKHCPLLWKSPTKYIMGKILDYTFRAARAVAGQRSDRQDRQDVMAVYTGEELRYVTNFKWLAASIALMVLGMIAALSLSWRWWQLGRYVTLSPLETGKALGAPILTEAAPEQGVKSILQHVGHELVAYDDGELICAGSLYTSGVGASLSNPRPRRSPDGPALMDASPEPSDDHRPARRHRRTVRSLNEADPIRITRTFEHDRGSTTRAPYADEEEMDIGHGRPWVSDQSNDNVPLIQVLSNIAAPRYNPRQGVPQSESAPSPTRMQRRSLDQRKRRRASVRSPLPSIEERDMPIRGGSGR